MTTTEIKLYNTLTRTKEAFTPIDAKNVRMYVCGPTVYDFAHIGNARPVIVFDVLFRLLRHVYGESHVTYVRNITDVDDKINARAVRDFPNMPLNEAIREVTEKTANQYQKDMAALGCLDPTEQPRATEYIPQMAEMIQTLIDKGHAYVATGKQGREVLFRVGSMKNYGALSNRKLEDQQAGARIAVESHKENAGDFVLWKESAADEPGWDGTFDGTTIHGRPGWHIECSAMSKALLGEVFDIHGGGLDLIFPHHENEIAQSCCAHDTERMANIWMHNGFLQVEGKKMSKSDGNFITVHDVLETEKVGGRKWPGEVVRLAMLMTHYREPIDFTVKRLEEAEAVRAKWIRSIISASGFTTSAETQSSWNSHDNYWEKSIAALSNDLNFSVFFREINLLCNSADHDVAAKLFATLKLFGLVEFNDIRSLTIEEAASLLIPTEDEISGLITERLTHLSNQNWAEADRIRDELISQGIQLKDSKDSETGERITTWEVKR